MLPRPSPNKTLVGWLLFITALLATPVTAHNLDVSRDVAATFHLEPNHNPKAGETAQIWFALTRKGGQIIPLNQCNCDLAIYLEPRSQNVLPVLEPPLKAISAEQYQGIPGTEIVFPKAGAYKLELSGTPRAGANFKSFELSYEVTVAPGVAAPTRTNSQAASTPTITAQAGQPDNRWLIPAIAISSILSLGIAWTVWQRLRVSD